MSDNNSSIQPSVPSHSEQPQFTQADMDKLLADIRSGKMTEEKLIKLFMLQKNAELVVNSEISYFKSLLASFEGVKQSQKAIIEGVSNSLKPHVAILEKLATLPQSEENIRNLATVTIELARLQLEVNRTLADLNKQNNATWIGLAQVAAAVVVGMGGVIIKLLIDGEQTS